ncbi:MAG: hypothetical protein AB4368_02815 [Xenococcaceae cyanobacterium]
MKTLIFYLLVKDLNLNLKIDFKSPVGLWLNDLIRKRPACKEMILRYGLRCYDLRSSLTLTTIYIVQKL